MPGSIAHTVNPWLRDYKEPTSSFGTVVPIFSAMSKNPQRQPSSGRSHPGQQRSLAAALCSCSFTLAATGMAVAQDTNPGTTDSDSNELELQRILVDEDAVDEVGDANPYADPTSPYKVNNSASPKLTEPLLNTPKTVRVVPKETIRDTGSTSFKDVMRLQPGITLGTGEGGNAYGDRIFIRGFDARNDIYVDGLRDPGVISRETFAVEQIEILEGPSSTIGGRGTTGGSVNSVSKRPGFTDFAKVEAGIGNEVTKRLTFDVNSVVSPKLALRFNGLVQDGEVAGRDEVFDDRYGAAIAMAFAPTDNVTLDLDYYHLQIDAMPDWGFPYNQAENKPYDLKRSNFYGVPGRDFQDNKADIGTGRIRVDFSDTLQLDAQLRYGVTSNSYVLSQPRIHSTDPTDEDHMAITEQFGYCNEDLDCVRARAKSRDQENTFFGGQVNLIKDFHTGDVQHTAVLGYELSREEVQRGGFSASPANWYIPLGDPGGAIEWNGSVSGGTFSYNTNVDTHALYILDTIEFNDQWQLSAGLRHDWYDIEVKYRSETRDPRDYAHDSRFTNYNLGVVYKPRPNGSLYAAVGTSSNPPGEQLDGGTSSSYGGLAESYQEFEPEKNTNYEAGVKWDLFDERLNVSASVFQIEKSNQHITQWSRSGGTWVSRDSNDGASRSRGVSLNMAGHATEKLSLSGGLTWLNAEVTSNSLSPDSVGKRLANVPDFSASLLGRYQLTPSLAVGANIYYQSEVYERTSSNNPTSLPGYVRLDFMGEYKYNDYVSANLNILNVANVTYYDAFYRSSAPHVHVAPGRSAHLTLKVKW